MGVDFLGRDTGLGDAGRPEVDELLHDAFQLDVHVLRRVFATEAPVEQRAIAEGFARLGILSDHGFPAGDHTREQFRPVELLQPVHPCLDGLANQGAALLHFPLDGFAVEAHLR